MITNPFDEHSKIRTVAIIEIIVIKNSWFAYSLNIERGYAIIGNKD